MPTVCGRYVRTFAEANMGMLEGVSLNAPYDFFWVRLKAMEGGTLLCTGGREELRLACRSTAKGDRASVIVQDPLFGPLEVDVVPFLAHGEGPPIQGALFA